MGTIKNDSYICIQGFMVNKLGLKGTELMIYAIIYGFSQDGSSAFTGTISYLMQWCKATKRTVITALNELTNRGLLIKTVDTVGGVRVCKYVAVTNFDAPSEAEDVDKSVDDVDNSVENEDSVCAKNTHTGEEITPGVKNLHRGWCKNFTGSGVKSTPGVVKNLHPDNINNNLTDNLVDNINTPPCGGTSAAFTTAGVPSRAKILEEFDELWKSYPDGRKQGRKQAMNAYCRARKSGTSFEEIMAGLEAYKKQIAKQRTETRYIKQGGTWFGQEGWMDEYDTSSMAVMAVNRQQKQKSNPALGYRQHNYDTEDLRQMGIDLGEDVYIA